MVFAKLGAVCVAFIATGFLRAIKFCKVTQPHKPSFKIQTIKIEAEYRQRELLLYFVILLQTEGRVLLYHAIAMYVKGFLIVLSFWPQFISIDAGMRKFILDDV